ncbi:hypothetical protein TYRP_012601 [Tyrophagus putrescentiae]|nr:hypothetical protein TYRP_012601 [Tyrophagus putrescentiae]
MAFGKKSFLIRDILESRGQTMSPSNSLIDWIIRNRADYIAQGLQGSTSSSQPIATSSQEKSSFPSNLYQNLYYYAIQQQISASLACNPSDDNFVDQNNTSDLGAIQSKIVKCKNFNVKRPISATVVSPSPRKRPSAAKPKRMNQVVLKKAKNAKEALANQAIPSGDLGKIEEVELDLSLRNDLNWTTESSECKCDINDEQEDGVNSCGAKSKCKKLRRNRTVFTELQLMGLERRFDSQKYLSTPDRADLARALGLTQLQVKTWYQNRRMKWKKQARVMQQGCPYPPTKPKGRPKKDSIPTCKVIPSQLIATKSIPINCAQLLSFDSRPCDEPQSKRYCDTVIIFLLGKS